MKAIFLYDITGYMAQPWLNAGYECWTFDGQHSPGITREGNLVKVGTWFYPDKVETQAAEIATMVGPEVVFVFGFPECTHLTVAGARHFAAKASVNPEFQNEAVNLAKLIPAVAKAAGCKTWALENPVGVMSSIWRKPDFIFNPCDYGGYLPEDDTHPAYPDVYPGRDAYNKGTCIWRGEGFQEPVRRPVQPLHKANPGWAKCGGKSVRTKNIRSATPRGFSQAVFEANAPHLKDLI